MFMLKKIHRNYIKKGIHQSYQKKLKKKNVWNFKADIHIINGHYTTIKMNYQPYLHINNVRQTAKIIDIEKYNIKKF